MSSRPGRHALALVAAAFAVRVIVAALSHVFSDPLNHYYYLIQPDGRLLFRSPGFMAPGGYYVTWLMYVLGGRSLIGLGLIVAAVGSIVPLLLVQLSPVLFPAMSERQAWLAGWLAVFFPPLVMVSAGWRYMLPAVLFALWSLSAIGRQRAAEGAIASTLLLLTRADYWVVSAVAALALLKGSWKQKAIVVALPLLLAAVHKAVVPDAFSGPRNFWYNVDAGLNPQTRNAVIGYGPAQPQPEDTLSTDVHDEAVHRARVLAFVASEPRLVVEALVMKTARLFDVRRDGALTQGPLENAAYTSTMLLALLAALLGVGRMGLRGAWPGLLVALVYCLPMVAIFSLDRMRVLFQALWLMPAAFWLDGLRD